MGMELSSLPGENSARGARSGSRAARGAASLERVIGSGLELVAAFLVVAEVVILFAGICARYVLRAPLVWSDELASILFVWLAMLGAAVVVRRGEHMRMTAVVGYLGPRGRAFADSVAIAASLLFVMLVLYPAYDYASSESDIVTAALEISTAWRVAALPAGFALMVMLSLLRLVRTDAWAHISAACALVAACAGGFVLLQPLFAGLGNANLVIFFVGVVAAGVLAGVPIAFSFGLSTFGYLSLATDMPLLVVVGRFDEGMSNLILLAVPMFVLLGALMEATGMARALVRFLASLFGHMRGGLSYVMLVAMYLVSGISGSKAADMAAVAPVLFPEMIDRGAKPGDLVALLSATGAQTETVPPSLVLITIGSVTGVSIAALFTGGLLPSLILGISLCGVVWLRYRKENLSHVSRPSRREIGRAMAAAAPALVLPFIIRGAVIEGIATATEVSTIGIAYRLVIGILFYRSLEWRRVLPMLVETASLSGAILLIIGAATSMAWGLTQSGFSHSLVAAMKELPGGGASFIAISIVLFIVLGSVLEGLPAIVLFGPLLFPIARGLGVNEVHYAMVVILAMGLGLFAPPFGVGYYSACAVGRVDPVEGMKPIWGYMLALLIGLVVVAAIPWLSTGFL